MITVDLLTVAKKINNYEADATSGTLWTSTTTFDCVVPAGKRWFILGGVVSRDVSATLSIRATDVSDKVIAALDYQGATTGMTSWPNVTTSTYAANWPMVLDAGEYVTMIFGTAQSTVAFASCVVLEVDV